VCVQPARSARKQVRRDTVPVQPETRYARSGEVNVAYQVTGGGPVDIVYVDVISHLELRWESPAHAAYLNRLASIGRLITLNQRGTGMSDRPDGSPTLETRMDDIRAVMDAAGSERAVVFGLGDAGPLCVLFAATYPERTSALVLINSSPRSVRSPELPWLETRAEAERRADEFERRWGETGYLADFLRQANPGMTDEEAELGARLIRLSASPGSAAAYVRANLDTDVCDVLPLVRVPTLVLHRKETAAWDVGSGRYLADHIAGARFVELPGGEFSPGLGDQETLFAALESFLDNASQSGQWEAEPERVLATVLFTDIVGATTRAVELGDRAWRELLARHHEAVRTQLARFRGKEVDTAGDGFFASFDGPARAIACACAIVGAMPELGLAVRAGLHTGECELIDGKAAGIAVHTGARVASNARPGEVLVSSTVKDLVAGSGIAFQDRGLHDLKGIPGEWRLYAVAR
jgi:class 3 adenylate cyclase/pimeloyl-ACP methyl ester carboxylesterase